MKVNRSRNSPALEVKMNLQRNASGGTGMLFCSANPIAVKTQNLRPWQMDPLK